MFTIEQKREVFKECANKTLYQVGLQFGLDKVYKKKGTIEQKIYQIKREVIQNPQEFGITQDVLDIVAKGTKERTVVNREDPTVLSQDEVRMVDLTQTVAKKALAHIDKKLSKKDMSKVSITQLAQVFGISLDKFLLLTGRATENIAFKAKIDTNMTSDQLMSELLKMREVANEQEEAKKS